MDNAAGSISVNRSTYTTGTELRMNQSGFLYITASDFSDMTSMAAAVLCAYWDVYLYDRLDFGLKGLGFTSFDGIGSAACDKPSGYHNGALELRNQRAAGCIVDGYTGDYYCTNCGEKVKTGNAISSVGYHSYDNTCDKDCNVCGEGREIIHTYTSDCDEKCNICNYTRIAVADHIFGSNGICTECGALDCIPGDLTGDGKINSLDGLMLLRYLNGWNVNIASPEAMDVNGDGKVNSLDGLILMRYLNGWNVTLG